MARNDSQYGGWRTVALQLQPETSSLIAELRAGYAAEGREVSSLARVVCDAVLQYHSEFYAIRPRPSDASQFFRTEPKDDC